MLQTCGPLNAMTTSSSLPSDTTFDSAPPSTDCSLDRARPHYAHRSASLPVCADTMTVRARLCDQCKASLATFRTWTFTEIYDHQPSLTALQRASSDACPICRWLLLKWHAYLDAYPEVGASGEMSTKVHLIQWRGWYGPTVDPRQQSIMVVQYILRMPGVNEATGSTEIAVAFELGSDTLSNEGPAAHTGSPSSLSKARQWLKDCADSHELCRPTASHWRPARLVALKGCFPGPALAEAERDDYAAGVKYATLSHRWLGNEFCLLRGNVKDLRRSIPTASLKADITDAFRVAESMGLAYVWIDTLCICQDDPNDKLEQINKMDQVYSNSACNIGAWKTISSMPGLFSQRDPSLVQSFDVKFQDISDGSEQHHTICLEWDISRLELAKSILHGRGWVFQERLLSPRLLYCGPKQLHWECRQSETSETYPKGKPAYAYNALFQRPSLRSRMMRLQKTFRSPWQDRAFIRRDLWREVVSEYTQCELTFQSDRLLALSGISAYWNSFDPARTYASGLWLDNLPRDLLWRCHPTNDSMPQQLALETPIAPTWSWASVSGQVRFNLPIMDQSDEGVLTLVASSNIEIISPASERNLTPMLPDPGYGDAGSLPRLRILGRPIRATVCSDTSVLEQPQRGFFVRWQPWRARIAFVKGTPGLSPPIGTWRSHVSISKPYESESVESTFIPDKVSTAERMGRDWHNRTVVCLPLIALPPTYAESEGFALAGLVLTHAGLDDAVKWQRVGVFTCANLNVPYTEQEEVVIV